jgi:acyl-CoA dehydrogenase
MATFILLLTVVVIGTLAYHRVPLRFTSLILLGVLLLYSFSAVAGWLELTVFWLLFIVVVLPLNIIPLRRKLISQRAFDWYRTVMPKMSRTEKEALEAGTVSWEQELFGGKPNWQKLLTIPVAHLTAEEQAFIDGPVEQLCRMVNDWDVTHNRADMPSELWQFLKDQGFFGIIIPKKFGGKEFSAYAHSQILCKVYGISVTAATTIGVPNSLGPAELLLHYGTDEQQQYYLPRLARGEEIPCFALTNPVAGSDAGSIPDTGIVCHGQFDGKEVIGIRLNWNKRYITLAPIATVLGLAFKLFDPEKLIGDEIEYGITCALIPTTTAGITIGRRHFPLNTAFLNGPTQGKDVFIPIDWIIGGVKMAGQGWRMLVECLSAGRAISLPASAIGGSRIAALTTGAYARIRKQFNLPIGKFEGVAEALTRIAGRLYLIDAANRLTLAIVDSGEKPSVLSAIMKYHATEFSRMIGCDAMDIHGGKGICLGPRNYLGRFYQSAPIAITVEGANILTRNMIIFGQGAIRCHQYVLAELAAAQDPDQHRGMVSFDKALFGHVGLVLSNLCRSVWLSLTNARLVKSPVSAREVRRYYQWLMRFSSAFSLTADLAMSALGSELKRRERLSARLGDILSFMYMISAVLKRYEDEGRQIADLPLVHWSCREMFFQLQEQLDALFQNFPNKTLAVLLRCCIFPFGKPFRRPDDRISQQVAEILLSPSTTRDRLTAGTFKGNIIGFIESTLQQVLAAEPIESKLQKAVRDGILRPQELSALLTSAVSLGVITDAESKIILNAESARLEVIAVDDFSSAELARH